MGLPCVGFASALRRASTGILWADGGGDDPRARRAVHRRLRRGGGQESFLRLAGVPFERRDAAGGPSLKLVDVKQETEWQMGAASPAFGTRELNYLPFPGEMVKPRTNMRFVYVSLDARQEVDLRDFLAAHPSRVG
jgi:hypothetical protein